jgi:hypothetical protein
MISLMEFVSLAAWPVDSCRSLARASALMAGDSARRNGAFTSKKSPGGRPQGMARTPSRKTKRWAVRSIYPGQDP